MNLVISIVLFLLALLTILLTFYNSIIESMTTEEKSMTTEDRTLRYVKLACPPPGEDGTIQCPNIEDPNLKKQTCEALVQRCQIELNNDNVKTHLKPTNPTKGMMLFN